MYDNRHRYYDPEHGCYTQVDPIGLSGGNPTLYKYVTDPNSLVDFFGLRRADHPLVGSGNDVLGNDTPVVRGCTNKADQFTNGSGVTTGSDGKSNGVSVNSSNGLNIDQLSEGIPNGKIGTTTVGEIRDIGGDVIPSPNGRNPNHATLSGITANQAEELFNPVIPNPSKK